MTRIRIEFVPVKVYNLGLFGFDHLQLVLEQGTPDASLKQDGWFVLEGLRDAQPEGVFLDVLGYDGITTLSEANGGLSGEALVKEIGTPLSRGSRFLLVDNPLGDWLTMANYGDQIHLSDLPYRSYAFPSSPHPTINSSSVVATLLWSIGLDPFFHMPFGLRVSPGTTTLLGTTRDDHLKIESSFTTLVGGDGSDLLEGSDALDQTDKLYGGYGNDLFVHSKGFNIIHGGQPDAEYKFDGIDTVDYSGVGVVRIERNPFALDHFTPEYIAEHDEGLDWLFSIERIAWNPTSDRIILGPGVELADNGLSLDLGDQSIGDQGDILELAEIDSPLLINAAAGSAHFIQVEGGATERTGLWVESAEWIVAGTGADRIYAGADIRGVEGGDGDDLLDARLATPFSGASPQGYDIELDGGKGGDTLISGAGRTLMRGGEGDDTFILSAMTSGGETVEVVIEDADAGDRLLVGYNFFNGSGAGFDGSLLLPLLGAHGPFSDMGEHGASLYFQWILEAQLRDGLDFVNGIIPFIGAIEYNLDGDDLLIHLYQGVSFTTTTEIDDAGNTVTYLDNAFLPETETIVRVKDFTQGDLGLQFIDLGPPVSHETVNGASFPIYAGYDAMIRTLTDNGVLADSVASKPDAPLSNPNEDGGGGNEPPPIVSGTPDDDTIVLTTAGHVLGGDGRDTITGSDGNDIIDGGNQSDLMTGGEGDDVYIVESAGDQVIETSGKGSDTVISSIDYTLPDHVETLRLAGLAIRATGNSAANRIVGNEGDNVLVGLGGNDTLTGGAGNDILDGGTGNDGYIIQADEGYDTIVDHGGDQSDLLMLVGGVMPDDLTAYRPADDPRDLVLALATGGRIRIDGFLDGHGIDDVLFEDGTRWSRGDLEALAASAPIVGNDVPVARDDLYLVLTGSECVLPQEALLGNDVDYDGDQLTIAAVGDAIGATVAIDADGNIAITQLDGHEGLVTFTYLVDDGHGGQSSARVEIAIAPNAAPTAANSIETQTVDAGAQWSLTLPQDFFVDADGDQLFFAASLDGGGALPDWLTFDPATRTLSGQVPHDFADPLDITIVASDGLSQTAIGFELQAGAPTSIPGPTHDDDVLFGSSAKNRIRAGDGNDIVFGLGGNDRLMGGKGDDRLFGGAGRDVLHGGRGDDTLSGGKGNDFINGGRGSDTAVFSGQSTDFALIERGKRTYVVDLNRNDGFEGIDTLVGVEWLQFDDALIRI